MTVRFPSRATGGLTLAVSVLMMPGCVLDTRAEYESIEDSRPVGEIETLIVEMDLGVGRFELVPAEPDGPLYSLSLDYDRLHYEPDIDFTTSDSEATLRFALDSTGSFPVGDNENHLRLALSPDVTLELELGMGVGESTLEFDNLQLRNLRYEGGVGRTEGTFPTAFAVPAEFIELESGIGEIVLRGIGNTRVADFRFDGGVGATEIDFSGAWLEGTTRADIEVGIGEVQVVVPEDIVVEIEAGDGFLTEVNAPGFSRTGRILRSGPADEPVRIDMRIEAGLGEIRISRN